MMASHKIDDADLSQAQATWFESGAGKALDGYMSDPDIGYDDWVSKIDERDFKLTESSFDCATIGGDCGPIADCSEFLRVHFFIDCVLTLS